MSGAAGVAVPAIRPQRRHWVVPTLAVAASTALILGPLLPPGYVLSYDMVFAPRMPVDAAAVGLGSQLPRAVPSDLVVALLSHVVPGDLVQKLVLVAILAAAGLGAAALTTPAVVPRCAAALAYLWTPYLGERLLLGQWAVLIGYAALPWLVRAARRVAVAEPGAAVAAWARFVLILGVMCLGGAPAWLLALLTAPVVLGWGLSGGVRSTTLRVLAGLLALVVFALPWAVPALLRPGGIGADPTGAVAFAPRSDTAFGSVVSVLTGGGVWNAETVPPGHDALLSGVGAVLLLALGIVGAYLRRRDPIIGALTVAGGCGLGIALITCWPAGARGIGRLPAGAVLRDAQRLVAPWVLLLALGIAAVCAAIGERSRDLAPAAALLALLPVAVLPSLAWGVSGRLSPVHYPVDYTRVRALIDNGPRPAAVAVLPFAAYRRFGWNHSRPVMQPLGRWLDQPLIVAADLPVARAGKETVVRGEDRLAARIGQAVRAAETGGTPFARALGRYGVRWVIVDAPVDPVLLAGLIEHYRGSALRVYAVPGRWVTGPGNPTREFAAPRAAVIAGDVAALVAVGAAALTTGLSTDARLRKPG